MHTNEVGLKGEKLAAKYLKKQKYIILERNNTTKIGEVDIIALRGEIVAFIEVKSSENAGGSVRPSMRVDAKRRQKYETIANFYAGYKNLLDKCLRFDVIEVIAGEINHIENAF